MELHVLVRVIMELHVLVRVIMELRVLVRVIMEVSSWSYMCQSFLCARACGGPSLHEQLSSVHTKYLRKFLMQLYITETVVHN